MKILIDTNVILDVLCGRPEFVDDSLKVFWNNSICWCCQSIFR